MPKLAHLTLALAAVALASVANAAGPWPAQHPKDKSHFCGTNDAADGTAPPGYATRLSAELRRIESTAGLSVDHAMSQIAALAGCPRETWSPLASTSGVKTTRATTAAAAPRHGPRAAESFGMTWPASSPSEAAWLCERGVDQGRADEGRIPPNYSANLHRALLARAAAGMSLEQTVQDIRKAAGCPINKAAGQARSANLQ